jgi:hypothetical protein
VTISGRSIAAVKLRDVQLVLDLDVRELCIVRRVVLERTELARWEWSTTLPSSLPSSVQSWFDATYGDLREIPV